MRGCAARLLSADARALLCKAVPLLDGLGQGWEMAMISSVWLPEGLRQIT